MKKIRSRGWLLLLKFLTSYSAIVVLILMFLFLSFTLPRFLTLVNLTNLVRQLSITLVVAAGVTVVMIGGEIDISVGSIVTLSAIICGMGINRYGVGIGMLSGVAAGLTIGALNGLFVAVFKTPSFITTLSTMLIARSLSYVISRGQVISNFPQGFRGLSQSEFLGIPVLMIYVILVYLLTNWYMLRTRFGKYVYATGSNEISAGLCGIKTTGVKFTTFIISGLYSGFAGILLLSRIMAVQADTARNMELEVFASVIVGGTALYGGRGNVLMTIVGVFIIGMIRNAVNLSRIDMFWNDLLTGVIILVALLVAVGWNRFRRISGEMLGASE